MNTCEKASGYPLIDGHAHLAEIDDGRTAVDEAREAGILAIVAVGMDLNSNRRTLQTADEHRGFVFPAIGYHPWSVKTGDVEKTLSFIEEHIALSVALGECGLDYATKVDRSLQEDVFSAIIALACRHDKALILHSRRACKKVFSLIRGRGVAKAVFHWYVDTLDLLREIIEAGYYISATPALLYSPPHQAAVREAPLDRIILETDCPVNYRTLVSRPRDVLVTLREVARIKGLTVTEVGLRTSQNTVELLGFSGINIRKILEDMIPAMQ